jgi:hypothetical protein
MPLYQSMFNGGRMVYRQVQKKKGDDVREQKGGSAAERTAAPAVQLSVPAIPKPQDKKALRMKMAALLMQNL